MTDIERLFIEAAKISYPVDGKMVKVDNTISGLAFFPAGKGTFENDDILSNKSIMILGQDFDCKTNYDKTYKAQKEDHKKILPGETY
ncbi:MAG: hypothetical protein V4722_21725 [Bacteroidota bacterium]